MFFIDAVLERVEIVEVMRRLNESHLLVRKKTQRLLQKARRRSMIGIEQSNVVGVAEL